jgi:hypothetical protein
MLFTLGRVHRKRSFSKIDFKFKNIILFKFFQVFLYKMNIFFLSYCTRQAAQEAIDKHVVKMILESTQLLYTAQWLSPNNLDSSPLTPYKIAHKNHPSAIWARSSIHNYFWLCSLGLEYCEEYKFRYSSPKHPKQHACQVHLEWLVSNPPALPDIPFWEPPQCMPDQYKSDCCITAYRNYYLGEKLKFAKYTKRQAPDWIAPYLQ